MMFWFKLRRDNNVVVSDLKIEAVKSEEREANTSKKERWEMDGTLEIDKRTVIKVLMQKVPVTRSRNQLRHRQCSDQHRSWCCVAMSV